MRNICCLVAYWAFTYLCATVSYVGLTHANLLKLLESSDTVSNLPAAIYQWLFVVPVIAAWWFPQPRHLKPLAITSIALRAAATALVAVMLFAGASPNLMVTSVLAHAAVFGITSGILMTVQWDLVKRGISSAWRGRFMSVAFGVGPVFACLGALFQDALFEGKLLGGRSFGLAFPDNFCLLFAVVAPLLLLQTVAIVLYRLPAAAQSTEESATTTAEIAAGFRQFIGRRVVWTAVLLYVLVYSGGNAILSNVSLHAQSQSGGDAETLGIQSFLRFGAKAVAGVLLGLLLTRSTPRAPLMATTGLLLAGMAWALGSSGDWFLATFALLGAGELFGAYFPNYITAASEPRFVRINIAYMNVLGVLIGFSALAFGAISDAWGREASFVVSAAMLVLSLLLIFGCLPAQPERGE